MRAKKYLVGVYSIKNHTYTTDFANYIDAADHYDYLCERNITQKLFTKIYLCEILEEKEVAGG